MITRIDQLYTTFQDNASVTKKLNAYDWFYNHKMKVSEISRLLNIHRSTAYRWIKQVKDVIDGSVIRWQQLKPYYRKRKDTNNRKLGRPTIISGWLVKKVFKIRERCLCGKNKIARYLYKLYQVKVSASTVGRILNRYKSSDPKLRIYYKDRYPKIPTRKLKDVLRPKDIPKNLKPMQAIQIDTKYYVMIGRKIYYIFAAIDIKTRMLFAMFYRDITARSAADFLERAMQFFRSYGDIEYVQTDNGSEFKGMFNSVLNRYNIKHVYSYPSKAYQNGKIERAMRTLEEEYLPKVWGFSDIAKLNDYLYEYLVYYNTERIHQSLDYRTPLEYLLEELGGSKVVATFLNPYR